MENNQSLYRFTTFEALVDIVQREALTFVSPTKWEDTYEGFLFKNAKTTEGQKIIIQEFKKTMPPLMPAIEAWALVNRIYAYFWQCWTTKDESDALWRIYSHDNKSVRVEITFEDALKLENVITEEVEYFSKLDLKKEIQNILWPDWESIMPYKALLSKREAFRHEYEVRLILTDFSNLNHVWRMLLSPEDEKKEKKNLASQVNSWILTEDDAERIFWRIIDYKELAASKQVSFKEIPNFIKSVMLHPNAPNWLNETLAEYCKRAGITYLGKSKLYKLELG